MKHPVLTRLFAIALAILSGIMLLAGALGIPKAAGNRYDALADRDRLQRRLDEYETVTQALAGQISYEEANRLLTERQEQHDENVSRHKSDLALYTATRGGIAAGEEAMDQAQAAMDAAWSQYRAGRAEFEKGEETFNQGYEQFLAGKAQIEAGYAQLDALEAAVASLGALADGVEAIELHPFPSDPEPSPPPTEGGEETPDPETPDPEDPDPETPDPETPDPEDPDPETPDPETPNPEMPDPETPDPETPDPETPDPETPDPETPDPEIPDPENPFPEIPWQDLPWLKELPNLSVYTADREQTIRSYDSLLDAYGQVADFIASMDGQTGLDEEQARLLQMLKETLDLVLRVGQELRDRIARGSGDLRDLELAVVWTAHSGGREALRLLCGSLAEQIGPMLEQGRAALDAGRAEMDAMEGTMETSKAAIEQGRAALDLAYEQLMSGSQQLYSGQQELEQTVADLVDQALELMEEKENLEMDAEELARMAQETRERKELERRQTSLKVMLLDREGISQRVNEGMELTDGAEGYLSQIQQDADREYKTRFAACLLMILGGVAGILCLPAAFEKLRSRFALIFPVLVCLACAIAAETVFETMGRGSSYSAIFAGIFALIQLLVVLPRPGKGPAKGA